MNGLSAPQSPTVGRRLEELHHRVRREHPSVDRVACAVYDRSHGRLRTFVHSSDAPSPLSRYEVRLGDVPSLMRLAEGRRDRVIDDLLTLEPPLQHHSRQLKPFRICRRHHTPQNRL